MTCSSRTPAQVVVDNENRCRRPKDKPLSPAAKDRPLSAICSKPLPLPPPISLTSSCRPRSLLAVLLTTVRVPKVPAAIAAGSPRRQHRCRRLNDFIVAVVGPADRRCRPASNTFARQVRPGFSVDEGVEVLSSEASLGPLEYDCRRRRRSVDWQGTSPNSNSLSEEPLNSPVGRVEAQTGISQIRTCQGPPGMRHVLPSTVQDLPS